MSLLPPEGLVGGSKTLREQVAHNAVFQGMPRDIINLSVHTGLFIYLEQEDVDDQLDTYMERDLEWPGE